MILLCDSLRLDALPHLGDVTHRALAKRPRSSSANALLRMYIRVYDIGEPAWCTDVALLPLFIEPEYLRPPA